MQGQRALLPCNINVAATAMQNHKFESHFSPPISSASNSRTCTPSGTDFETTEYLQLPVDFPFLPDFPLPPRLYLA